MTEFNLWDVEVGKQLGYFTDEREALALVKKLVAHYGDEYADELGLGRKSASGSILEPLSGSELLARMRELLPDHDPAEDRRGVVIGSTVG
jgi:hypothetical protein